MLGTPPAFVLSQDQTLNKYYLNCHTQVQLKPYLLKLFLSFYFSQKNCPLGLFQNRLGPFLVRSVLFHCLIYKVHRFALAEFKNTTFFPACQLLFLLFFRCRLAFRSRSRESFVTIPPPTTHCQYLFSPFFDFFLFSLLYPVNTTEFYVVICAVMS